MSDRCLRELERRAVAGDAVAAAQLIVLLLRLGARDPRRWPQAGDVVRKPMHGSDFERWDVRRVVSCAEESLRPDPLLVRMCSCARFGLDVGDAVSFAKGSPALHWERTEASLDTLQSWGLARDRCGTMARLGSWRSWAKKGEVLVIADWNEG